MSVNENTLRYTANGDPLGPKIAVRTDKATDGLYRTEIVGAPEAIRAIGAEMDNRALRALGEGLGDLVTITESEGAAVVAHFAAVTRLRRALGARASLFSGNAACDEPMERNVAAVLRALCDGARTRLKTEGAPRSDEASAAGVLLHFGELAKNAVEDQHYLANEAAERLLIAVATSIGPGVEETITLLQSSAQVELFAQAEKWGLQDHPVGAWGLIVAEELGEWANEMLTLMERQARTEAVQVLACLARFIEKLGRSRVFGDLP